MKHYWVILRWGDTMLVALCLLHSFQSVAFFCGQRHEILVLFAQVNCCEIKGLNSCEWRLLFLVALTFTLHVMVFFLFSDISTSSFKRRL
jgi:hypothetical protein